MLRNPLSHLEGDIKLRMLMANHRPTKVNLQRDARRLTETTTRREKGDGLVPFSRTFNWLDGFTQRFVLALRRANEHAFLCTDPGVMAEVRSFLAS